MMMLSPAFALLVLLGPAVLKADRPEHRIGFEAPAHAAGFRAADWEAYAPAGVRFVDGPERASLDDTLFHAGRHLSLIHISEPTRHTSQSRMPSSA